jgi:hypothetical protein
MITKIDAINSLVPNCIFSILENGEIHWIQPRIPPISKIQIEEEIKRLEKEYEDNKYQRDRANAYPSIPDQLDMLYHNGFDAWKTMIESIKKQYPKP